MTECPLEESFIQNQDWRKERKERDWFTVASLCNLGTLAQPEDQELETKNFLTSLISIVTQQELTDYTVILLNTGPSLRRNYSSPKSPDLTFDLTRDLITRKVNDMRLTSK